MNSYKCAYCEHQVGPVKPAPPICVECRCGNHFQIKAKMYPAEAANWEKHQRFDRFIDHAVGDNIVLWQRELLHKCLDNRPLCARGDGRSRERLAIYILLALFYDYEKETKN